MTTHENAPPPADWSPEPRDCVLLDFLEYAGRVRADVLVEIPPNIVLGDE